MSIWSRSHSDLARLAKNLKERNAQTRQGLVERGRSVAWQGRPLSHTHKVKDDTCIPSSSSYSSSLDFANACPQDVLLQPSCDRLNLSDSSALALSFVQRGRVDSFSSADSAISPDFHGGPHTPLSPILKKSSSHAIGSGSNHLLIPGNIHASPKTVDRKVTFSLEDDGFSTALLSHHKTGTETGNMKLNIQNKDSHDRSNVTKFNRDSAPATTDISFSQDISSTESDDTSVVFASSPPFATEQAACSNSEDIPQSRVSNAIEIESSVRTSISHETCITKSHRSENEDAKYQNRLSSGEMRRDLLKSDDITNPNVAKIEKEHHLPSAGLITSQYSSLHKKPGSYRSKARGYRPNSLPSEISHMRADDPSKAHDDKTTDSSLMVVRPASCSAPTSPLASDGSEKKSSVPVSSLNLTNELNARLISVLANHKRQNLQRSESISSDKPESNKTTTASVSEELIDSREDSCDNAITVKLLNLSCAVDKGNRGESTVCESPPMSSPIERQKGESSDISAVTMDKDLAGRSKSAAVAQISPALPCHVNNIENEITPNQFCEGHEAREVIGATTVSEASPAKGAQPIIITSQSVISNHNRQTNTHVPNLRLTPPEKPFELFVNTPRTARADTVQYLPDPPSSISSVTIGPISWSHISPPPQTHHRVSSETDKKSSSVVSSELSNMPNFSFSTFNANGTPPPQSSAFLYTERPKSIEYSGIGTEYLSRGSQPHFDSLKFSKGPNAGSINGFTSPELSNTLSQPQKNIRRTAIMNPSFCEGTLSITPFPTRMAQSHNDTASNFTSSIRASTIPHRTSVFAETLMPLNVSLDRGSSLIWSLPHSARHQDRSQLPKPYNPLSFVSTSDPLSSIMPTIYRNTPDFFAFLEGSCSKNVHYEHFNNGSGLISTQPMPLFERADSKSLVSPAELVESFEDDLSSISLTETNISAAGKCESSQNRSIAAEDNNQTEFKSVFGSNMSLASNTNYANFSGFREEFSASVESFSIHTVSGDQDEGCQKKSLKEVSINQNYVPNDGNVSLEPALSDSVCNSSVSELPPSSQFPLTVNYCNRLDENLVCKGDGHRDLFDNAERNCSVEQEGKNPLGKSSEDGTPKFIEHGNEHEEEMSQKLFACNTSKSCLQNGQDKTGMPSKSVERSPSPPCKDHHDVSPESSSRVTGKSDDSLLDLSFDPPSSQTKSHSSYRARVDRINDNVSRYLLSQFPANLKSDNSQKDTSRNEQNAFRGINPTLRHESSAKQKVPSGVFVSPTSQTHFRPLSPADSHISTHETVNSSTSSVVLLDILKTVQFLSGHDRVSSDGSRNGRRRLSITRKELKEILKHLKDSHDFLNKHPAPELRAVRDDLQKLSASLTQQLCRSKASLDRDIQHRNAIFQKSPLKKNSERHNAANNRLNASSLAQKDNLLSSCVSSERKVLNWRNSQRRQIGESEGCISETSSEDFNACSRDFRGSSHVRAPSSGKKKSKKARKLPNERGEDVDIGPVQLVRDGNNNNSFLPQDSTHINDSHIKMKGSIAGAGKAELMMKRILAEHNSRQAIGAEAHTPHPHLSKVKTRRRRKRINSNPFKEMYKFMCEEISMSMIDKDGDDQSDISALTSIVTETDTLNDDSFIQEKSGLTCREDILKHSKTGPQHVSSYPQQQQQSPQHQTHEQTHPSNHSSNTNSQQNMSSSLRCQDLNDTFCLQKSPSVRHVEVTELQGFRNNSHSAPSVPPEEVGAKYFQQVLQRDEDPQLSAEDLETREITSALASGEDPSHHKTPQTQSRHVENHHHSDHGNQVQQGSSSDMESDSDLRFQLDRDFDKHLADMKPHVLKLPQKSGKY